MTSKEMTKESVDSEDLEIEELIQTITQVSEQANDLIEEMSLLHRRVLDFKKNEYGIYEPRQLY